MKVAALKFLTAVFAMISAMTGIALYEVVGNPLDDPVQRPIQSWSPVKVLAESIGVAGAETRNVQHTFERPVFSPTRRPFVRPVLVEAAPPPPELPPEQVAAPDATGLQLKGVMLGGSTARALLTSPESPQGQWLTAGSTVMGWKLTRIGEDSVGLSAGNQTLELKLYVDNQPDSLAAPLVNR